MRKPSRIGAVAEQLGIAARSASEAVDGLVRRGPDPTDRRAVLVSLTGRGVDLVQEAEGPRRQIAADLSSMPNPEEQTELLRLLGIVRAVAETAEDPSG